MNKPRIVKHGVEERNAYCRQCEFSCHDINLMGKVKYHSEKNQHTVDVYTENWKEVTCYRKVAVPPTAKAEGIPAKLL